MSVCVTPLRMSCLARTPSEWFTQKRQDIESCQPSRLPGTLSGIPISRQLIWSGPCRSDPASRIRQPPPARGRSLGHASTASQHTQPTETGRESVLWAPEANGRVARGNSAVRRLACSAVPPGTLPKALVLSASPRPGRGPPGRSPWHSWPRRSPGSPARRACHPCRGRRRRR
jgi:hypothetical protein